jgi:hypothetical protein
LVRKPYFAYESMKRESASAPVGLKQRTPTRCGFRGAMLEMMQWRGTHPPLPFGTATGVTCALPPPGVPGSVTWYRPRPRRSMRGVFPLDAYR